MKITGGIDSRELMRVQETLALYRIATGKDLADTLNHFGKQVAIFASARTKKADRGKVESQLRRVLGHRIASKSGKRLKTPKPITVPTTLARALVVKNMRKAGEQLSAREITSRANKLIASRIRGIGYHKAGWIPALKEFGAGAAKAGVKAFGPPAGEASKATEARLASMLKNFAKGVDLQKAALDAAVREARLDMEAYATAKIRKRAAAASRKVNS